MGRKLWARAWEQLLWQVSARGQPCPARTGTGKVTGSSGTQFEGRTSVGCGVEELHFKDNLGGFFFFN